MTTYPILHFALGESFKDAENCIKHRWRVYVIHAFLTQ